MLDGLGLVLHTFSNCSIPRMIAFLFIDCGVFCDEIFRDRLDSLMSLGAGEGPKSTDLLHIL